MKNIRVFYLKIFSFLEVKFSIYLNRRVSVMNFASSAVILLCLCVGGFICGVCFFIIFFSSFLFIRCLENAVLHYCGISWVYSHIWVRDH